MTRQKRSRKRKKEIARQKKRQGRQLLYNTVVPSLKSNYDQITRAGKVKEEATILFDVMHPRQSPFCTICGRGGLLKRLLLPEDTRK